MDLLQYVLEQHAWAHAATVSESPAPTTADRLVHGLGEAEFRSQPAPGLNPLAWLIWHMARIEDATMNVFVAGTSQVLEENRWSARLRLIGPALGSGMDDAEVAGVSRHVDVAALLDYRIAVGRRTRAIIQSLQPAQLDAPVEPARVSELVAAGGSGAAVEWLATGWQGKPLRYFLAMPASAHNYLHLGEAWCIRSVLGAGGGR